MAGNTDTVCCPHHFEILREVTTTKADSVEHGKSIDKLWLKVDEVGSKTRGLEVIVPEVQKGVSELARRFDLYSDESDGYRHMTRTAVKEIEHLQVRCDKFAKKTELDKALEDKASLGDLKSLRFWIRVWGVGTIVAILALLANLFLVILPLVWSTPKGP